MTNTERLVATEQECVQILQKYSYSKTENLYTAATFVATLATKKHLRERLYKKLKYKPEIPIQEIKGDKDSEIVCLKLYPDDSTTRRMIYQNYLRNIRKKTEKETIAADYLHLMLDINLGSR